MSDSVNCQGRGQEQITVFFVNYSNGAPPPPQVHTSYMSIASIAVLVLKGLTESNFSQ